MHFFGYLIYVAVIAAIAFVPAANSLVVTSYNLATEITIGCLAVGSYPPLQFAYYHIRGLKTKVHFERMCSVSATCGNTVVSLGLIGTFVGLTQMIEKIAGAIGGEGGSLDEQIAIIMTAIGESLDAMSFAFLTSVMGVAASVCIFAATVYFKMYFDEVEEIDEQDLSDEAMDARLEAMEAQALKIRKYTIRMINGNVDRKEMASILVNNSQQVRTLTEATGKLSAATENQAHVNSAVTEALTSLTAQVNEILENQRTILKFTAGGYEELSKIESSTSKSSESLDSINSTTTKLAEGKSAHEAKVKQSLGALKDIFSS
jgi:hypothetical protein